MGVGDTRLHVPPLPARRLRVGAGLPHGQGWGGHLSNSTCYTVAPPVVPTLRIFSIFFFIKKQLKVVGVAGDWG